MIESEPSLAERQEGALHLAYSRNLLLLMLIFGSLTAGAQELCVRTWAEFEAAKEKLPKVMQKAPLLLVADSMLVTSAIKIRQAGERLKLEGHVWIPGSIYTDEGYIDRVCIQEKEECAKKSFSSKKSCEKKTSAVVVLDSGGSYTTKILSDRELEVTTSDGTSKFALGSATQFAGIVEKIKKQAQKKGVQLNEVGGGTQ